MSARVPLRWVRLYAGAVGAMDTATGLGLVVVPALTLAAMGARPPGAESLVYVRFAGVFVGAVGASYLLALAAGGSARLRTVLEITAVVRTAVAVFTGVAVAVGALDRGWLVVTATDLACAVIQGTLLGKGLDESR